MQTQADSPDDAARAGDGRLMRFVRRFLHQQLAAVAPMMALMLIPIVGGVAYAVELGSWQYMQRAAQNAADSAALAAATVDSDTGTTSQIEALAAARALIA
jgi:Flp pilus assembly protein TadG